MNRLIEFIKKTFLDKQQNPSGRELTIFLFVLMVVASWIGEQFFGKHIPEFMFILVAAGIGLYTFEKPNTQNDK
jgi:hypothetical protein